MNDIFLILDGITGGYAYRTNSDRFQKMVLQDEVKQSFSSSEALVLAEVLNIGQGYIFIKNFCDKYHTPNFTNPNAQLNGRFLSAFCYGTDSTLLEGYRTVYHSFNFFFS